MGRNDEEKLTRRSRYYIPKKITIVKTYCYNVHRHRDTGMVFLCFKISHSGVVPVTVVGQANFDTYCEMSVATDQAPFELMVADRSISSPQHV